MTNESKELQLNLEIAVNRFMEWYRDGSQAPMTAEQYLERCRRTLSEGLTDTDEWLADWNKLKIAYFATTNGVHHE